MRHRLSASGSRTSVIPRDLSKQNLHLNLNNSQVQAFKFRGQIHARLLPALSSATCNVNGGMCVQPFGPISVKSQQRIPDPWEFNSSAQTNVQHSERKRRCRGSRGRKRKICNSSCWEWWIFSPALKLGASESTCKRKKGMFLFRRKNDWRKILTVTRRNIFLRRETFVLRAVRHEKMNGKQLWS